MKKFILIICLSLMGFSIASQISFNSGMLSEILKFRIDFDKRSMALEDSENMLVQPEGPIFRRTGTEFIDEALTEFSYTVTDTNDSNDPNTPVYGDYTEYFVGTYSVSASKCVVKAISNSTVDVNFGISGYAVDSPVCHDMLQLDDGRLLVAHDGIIIDSNTYVMTMLNSDGSIDTTWGDNGYYSESLYPFLYIKNIFLCNDGSFLIYNYCNSGSTYVLHKISADGEFISARRWDVQPRIIEVGTSIWGSDTHEYIIIVGSDRNAPSLSYISNAMAIDVETLEPYTDWGGLGANVTSGYAHLGPEITDNNNCRIYDIQDVNDGFVLHHVPIDIDGTYYTLCKVAYDGNSYDESWGTSGHVTSTYPMDSKILTWDNTYLYNIGRKLVGNSYSDVTQSIMTLDSNGTIVNSKDITVPKNYIPYRTLRKINEYLIIGTTKGTPSTYSVEKWNTDYDLIDGFNIASILYPVIIFPDESIREITYTGGGGGETTTTTVTTLSSDKTRLIPFTYSNTDSYVLELGHNFVGFLR